MNDSWFAMRALELWEALQLTLSKRDDLVEIEMALREAAGEKFRVDSREKVG